MKLGIAYVESNYLSTDPRCLKKFELGEEVFFIPMDRMSEIFDNIDKLKAFYESLLDECINSDLTDERKAKIRQLLKDNK